MLAFSGHRVSDTRSQRSLGARQRGCLRVEELESRTLLSTVDLSNVVVLPAGHFASPNYNPNQFPGGYWPAQIRHAYGFDSLSYTGSGQTIAIVDAYDDPNIAGDLAQFDAQYGIAAPPSFTKATPQGQPAANAGWASEIALDVEWAHAIAPGANILLVEARDSSLINLLGAVDYAAAHGAQVVSMSWGAGEFSSETSYDYHFSRAGVTFVASSGDYGAPPEWPASSTHVLAVGGTSLNLNSNNTWNSETGWGYGPWSQWYGGSGGGISRYEPKPSYQSSVTQSSFRRTNPDVSYVADPNTGLTVYDSYGSGGWVVFGGTSVGAPQWAALVALVDQGRGAALTGDTQTLPAIYKIYKSANYSADFHDILSGNNGYKAGTGYDLVTGVGSPRANNLVPDLVKTTGSGSAASPPTTKKSGSASAPVIINVVLPIGSTLPAFTQAVPLGSVPNTAVIVGNQPGFSVLLPVSNSVPFMSAPPGPVANRIERGGDNAVLQDDEEPGREDMCLPSMYGQGTAALPAIVDSAAAAQISATLNQARDACFAGWTADSAGPSAVASRITSSSGGLTLDRTPGDAWLAVILGCCWSAQVKDSERRASSGGRVSATKK
jgi:hypothetical protein